MILTPAECRVALNIPSEITDAERAALEQLIPEAQAAIAGVLKYDPEYRLGDPEWYPKVERLSDGMGGVLDVNEAGTRAFVRSTGRAPTLQLARLPLRRITEIRVDYDGGFGQKPDTFGDDTVLTSGVDYYIELDQADLCMSGQVISMTGWPTEPGTVKVTYYAGYTAAELAGRATNGVNASRIKRACMLTLVKAFKTWKATGKQSGAGWTPGIVTSERLGDYSYSVDGSVASGLAGMKMSVPAEAIDLLQDYVHYGTMLL